MISRTLWACTLLFSGCAGSQPKPRTFGESGGPGGTCVDSHAADAANPPKHRRIDPCVVQSVVQADFPAMRACYEKGLARNPSLSGRVSARFTIREDGLVSEALDVHDMKLPDERFAPDVLAHLMREASTPRFPDDEVLRCIIDRFRHLEFPKPKGGVATTTYPILLTPDG